MHTQHIVERAFQLAKEANTIEEIRAKLKQEGYSNVDGHLIGPLLRADLTRIIRQSDASHDD